MLNIYKTQGVLYGQTGGIMCDYTLINKQDRIFDAINCGVLVLDGNLNILYANKEYESITGLAKSEIVGKTSYYMVQEGMASSSVSKQVQITKKCLSIIQTFSNQKTALVTGAPVFGSHEQLSHIIITANDITVQSQLYKELTEEKEKATAYKHNFENSLAKGIIHESVAMQNVVSTAIKYSKSSSSILLSGETGVGKEVIASLIHNASDRAHNPLIKVNCAAIPHALAESEFFGYEDGAFTGARRGGVPGIFELAHQGTVFLDEIEELPLAIQSKLLRTLQDNEVTRLGDTKSKKMDFRVITATNQPLRKLINEGKFRNDLYYRINILNILIPPLRERMEDVIPLVNFKLNQLIAKYHVSKIFSGDTLEFLKRYYWPGNVRELNNVVERTFFSCDSDIIQKSDVMLIIESQEGFPQEDNSHFTLKQKMQKIESEIIYEAFLKFRTMREVAAYLGMDPATLTRKCKQYQIKF